jgi:hypothetical protein
MDETKAAYVSSLQDIIRYNITYRMVEDASTHLPTLSLAIDTSIKDMAELLQGMTVQAWISSTATAHVKVKAILDVCPLPQQPRFITDMITHLLHLYADGAATRCWAIMAQKISETKKTTVDRLAWVIRLLDVLIVVVGTHEISAAAVWHGIATMVRQVLWPLDVVLPREVALADTGYLLAHAIAMAKGHDHQRQVSAKRRFTIPNWLTPFFFYSCRLCNGC